MQPAIILVSGYPCEAQTREQLLRLLERYDLRKWQLTDAIRIERGVIPHSWPIVTLNCRYLDNDHRALAVYLHEQLHWFAPPWQREVAAALDELQKRYPAVPAFEAGGARDELSTYQHLIVCPLEYASLIEVLGAGAARATIESMDFYTWIYATMLQEWDYFAGLLNRYGLEPSESRMAEVRSQIDAPPASTTSEIETRRVEPVLLASARQQVPWPEMVSAMSTLFSRVREFLSGSGLPTSGEVIVLYRGSSDTLCDLEVGVRVAEAFEGNAEVVCSATPGGQAAWTLHQGAPRGLRAAHDALRNWCRAGGLRSGSVRWEVREPWEGRRNPAGMRTDVYRLLDA